jgi:predicted porin
MKKSLIALAVLATTGAAMAQSSVTLYGRLDAGIGQEKIATTSAAAITTTTKKTQVTTSAFKTTYWGLKGTEDLGGGLKANFKLESQFEMDTGKASNTLFEREANVGLSGGFGTVTLGRQYTTQYNAFGATDNVGNANVSTGGKVFATGVANMATRADNALRYDSPSFAGVSGSLMYAFGENKNQTSNAVAGPPAVANTNNLGSSTDIIGASIKYAAGPVMVTYAHQEEKKAQTSLATSQVTNKYDLIGGTYDFGVAKLNAAYQQTKANATKDKEYNVGVTVPMGAFGLSAGYSKSKSTNGATELNSDGFTLAGTYNLSKRTSMYAAYYNADVATGAVAKTETTFFGAGVVHLF